MKNLIKIFVTGLFICVSFSCNSFAESIESIVYIQFRTRTGGSSPV